MGIYTLLLGLGSAIGAGVGGVLAQAQALNGLVLGTAGLAALALASLALLPGPAPELAATREPTP